MVFDRILNKDITFSNIESPIILGRYIFKSGYKNVLLNESKVKKQDFLVPYTSNEGSLNNKTENLKLIFDGNELIAESDSSIVKHTLLKVLEDLEIIEELSNSTTEYVSFLEGFNLLLRNIDEQLDISEFEHFKNKLHHVKEVCREPSYHLKREITKLNVARAKRIPVKAINYLAAHTEDWLRRRFRSVEPSKILSEIIEYDLEIYENQITTVFIYKLLQQIEDKIKEINKIKSFYQSATILKGNIHWYQKRERDCVKIDDAVNPTEARKREVEKVLATIISLKKSLSKLKSSELYKKNKIYEKRNYLKLKRTNLFDNHQHYRFIKVLWDLLQNKKEIQSFKEKSNVNQRVIKSFIAYSWVLIIRSLIQIGFTPIKKHKDFSSKKHEDFSFDLSHPKFPTISINMIINEMDIIDVKINNNNKISVIPIPATVEIKNIDLPQNTYLFTLLLAPPTDLTEDMDILTHFGSCSTENNIKISPLDINSEERVTRVFFKYFLEVMTDDFLFRLNSQKISRFNILKGWLKNNHSLTLDKGKSGKIDFFLSRKLGENETNELSETIKNQKQHLSARSDIRSKELILLQEIEDELILTSKKHFEKFEKCISCSTINSNNFIPNYRGGFKYKCNSRGCEVEYGFTIRNNRKSVFYKVPNYEDITKKLSSNGTEINEDGLLNAIGFQNI